MTADPKTTTQAEPHGIERIAMRIQQLESDIRLLREQLAKEKEDYYIRRFHAMLEDKIALLRGTINDYYDAVDPSVKQSQRIREGLARAKERTARFAEELDDIADHFDYEGDELGAREGLVHGMRAAGDTSVEVDTFINNNLHRSRRR